jgi:subtilisin family serine protease
LDLRRLTLTDHRLRGRTGAGVTVAVLDSGVHIPHPHLESVAESTCIDESIEDTVDRLGHGTAVAAAIHDIAPGARLIVGKIFDRSLATNAGVLAQGIAWAASRGARLINLSLGTTNPERLELLRDAVANAAALGAMVVSAREDNGVVWLPGSLSGVVGVRADVLLERGEADVDSSGFTAAPYPRPIPGVPKERNLRGVSFAVANTTGMLARLLEGRTDLRNVGELFREVLQEAPNQ